MKLAFVGVENSHAPAFLQLIQKNPEKYSDIEVVGVYSYDGAAADKESAFGLWGLYWLHQCGIPHRMCRFYLLLAGAVGKRQGIAIPYPSPTPLLTPGGIRCGGAYWLPRAYRDLVNLYPVQVAHPHFDISFGGIVFGLGLLAFQ